MSKLSPPLARLVEHWRARIRNTTVEIMTMRKDQFSHDVKIIIQKLSAGRELLETLRDETQEEYDNIPENLQNSARATDIEERADELDRIYNDVNQTIEDLETAIDNF